MGGEKIHLKVLSFTIGGSPPRGRGKAKVIVVILHNFGITPAWAGKSLCCPLPPTSFADHPRVGGEKQKSLLLSSITSGSPPRGRGKVEILCQLNGILRITPAWAGKSGRKRMSALQQGDHPRMGGEKNKELEGVWLPMGSPPRRRGKVVHCAAVRALRGITPRVGGEKPFLFCGGSSDSGSPPRGRGKEGFCLSQFVVRRITPA